MSRLVKATTIGVHTVKETIYEHNRQALKAAKFLLKNFPDKYHSRLHVEGGTHYMELSHKRNGYGTYFNVLLSLGRR